MIMYGISIFHLAEEIHAADPGIIDPLYVDNVTFGGSAQRSSHLLKMLIRRGPDQGYFTKQDKSMFIMDTPGQDESDKRGFWQKG